MPYSFLPHLAYIKKPNSKKKVNLIGGKGGDGGKSSGTGGTVSFPTTIKFAALAPYVASTGNNSVDVVTFISFDSSSLYAASVKTLI